MSETRPEPDAAAARAERTFARLERLADKGLAMVEALPNDGAPQSADSYVKLARSLRLTATLEAKLAAPPSAPPSNTPSTTKAGKDAAADPYAALTTGRKGRARELLIDVADHEIPDPEEVDDIIDALDERLLCDDAYADVEALPLRDVVERLCDDLQLKPDWRRWTGDGWKANPPFFRPLCSPFRRPSRKVILQDLTAPVSRE